MRQCKCGGRVREHVLTKDRVAWTCGDCGRYEVISPTKGRLERREDVCMGTTDQEKRSWVSGKSS